MPVKSGYDLQEKGDVKILAVTVLITYDGDRPSEADCLQAVDHLLSSIPGAAENPGAGVDRKGELVSKYVSWRSAGAR